VSGHAAWIGVDLDGTLAEYHGWKGAGVSCAPFHHIECMAGDLYATCGVRERQGCDCDRMRELPLEAPKAKDCESCKHAALCIMDEPCQSCGYDPIAKTFSLWEPQP